MLRLLILCLFLGLAVASLLIFLLPLKCISLIFAFRMGSLILELKPLNFVYVIVVIVVLALFQLQPNIVYIARNIDSGRVSLDVSMVRL